MNSEMNEIKTQTQIENQVASRKAGICVAWVALWLAMSWVLCGCGVMESTRNKTVNMQFGVYGGKVTASDLTSNGSPSFQMGFGDVDYHSAPAKAGQSFKARRTTWSIWGDRKSSETIIELGALKDDSVVSVKDISAGVIDVSSDGINTDTTIVEVKPIK